MRAPLGEFEVVILLAVLHLADEANGSAVLDHIARRTGRRASRGSVYITLDRLEEKGLLASRVVDAPGVRGGTKRLFRPTPAGIREVRHAIDMLERMRRGLDPVLGLK